MKRSIGLVAAVMLLTGVSLVAFPHDDEDRTTVTVKPSAMKDGETKTFTEDGRKITIRRDGTSVNVRIEGAGETKNVTVTTAGDGDVVIRHGSGDGAPWMVSGTPAPRVRVHGFPKRREEGRSRKLDNWFVCPKDKTMLRVPEENSDKEYKCPVDGTVMEKRKGHGFGFFFDDNEFEISM